MPGPEPTLADFWAAWELFRDPVLAATLAGATLGFLGVYVVLRRMVFVAAALSQAAGLGVGFAFYAEIVLGASGVLADPLVFASAATLVALVPLVRSDGRWVSRESVLGWVYLAGASAALLVGTRIQQEAHDIADILFGAAVLVTPDDLRKLALVAGGAVVLELAMGRGFRLSSFDRDGAVVRGLPVRLLDGALFGSIAIVVSFSTRVLGAMPVFAWSVLPAMAAILVAPSVRSALVLAALLGTASGALGYVVAFLHAWPVGASQAATAAAFVLVAAAVRALLQRRAGQG